MAELEPDFEIYKEQEEFHNNLDQIVKKEETTKHTGFIVLLVVAFILLLIGFSFAIRRYKPRFMPWFQNRFPPSNADPKETKVPMVAPAAVVTIGPEVVIDTEETTNEC